MIHKNLEFLSPCIGVVVDGFDLSQGLTKSEINIVYDLLLAHKVIFFRNQTLNTAEQEKLATCFSLPKVNTPEMAPDLSKARLIEAKADKHKHTWHTDRSWTFTPPTGAILHAIDVPECGGDTIWSNTEAAYYSLPHDTQKRISSLRVIHDNQTDLSRKGIIHPTVTHPLVRVHPDTKRLALWPSYNVDMHVEGFSAEESAALLLELHSQITKPEFQVRYRWKKGDVAFWDNRCTLHYAVKDYSDYPRRMRRVLVNRNEIPKAYFG